jgi:CarD family transcriptional regulator
MKTSAGTGATGRDALRQRAPLKSAGKTAAKAQPAEAQKSRPAARAAATTAAARRQDGAPSGESRAVRAAPARPVAVEEAKRSEKPRGIAQASRMASEVRPAPTRQAPALKSEMIKAEMTKPEASALDAPKPDMPKPDMPKAGTPKIQAAEPDGPTPEMPEATAAAARPEEAAEAPEKPSIAARQDQRAVEPAPAASAHAGLAEPVPEQTAGSGAASRVPLGLDRPPPRPPAKPEVFVEGDHVVYPTHGVGKVERIAIEEIAGHKLELIHITFEENRMTLRVPVAKARSAGLRKLATRKLFEEALSVLKGRARVKRTMWSRRAQEYEAKINSGDPLAIAEVVRDLHRNAGQPDQSFSERQIYESAMDRLAAELAALDQTDKMTAATKLSEFLKTV